MHSRYQTCVGDRIAPLKRGDMSLLFPVLFLLIAAIDPGAVNEPSQAGPVRPNTSGPAVLRAQILLGRAHFSTGQIDGSYGRNLGQAIAAYRAAHNLSPGETVDRAMWAELNGDGAPALTEYTIAGADIAGPFEKVPADMQEKAKLKHLGYESAEDALGEKFHAAPALLRALNPGKPLDEAGTAITVPNVIVVKPAAKVAQVVVNAASRSVEALDAAGSLVAFYPATTGSEHDPLPVGTWKILGVSRDPVFNYNSDLFWDAKGEHAEAKIAPGPRNPVGVVWIALSKEHYGIHGTPEPGSIGHTQSHGCIRLTNWDASELAAMVSPGTPAILKEQ
jgi:lipoprotein-anchoring transpeptidase ErfK/SrfK